MRFQGRITSWDEARGFGFITWNGGSDKVFVHISAFTDRRRRPAVGDIVSYEVAKNAQGRHQAEKVAFPVHAAPPRSGGGDRKTSPLLQLAVVGLLVAIGLGVALRYQTRSASRPQEDFASVPAERPSRYQCEGKTHCSEMVSCAEAQFYLRHCPNPEMDGDGDGIPCESQWCGQ